MKHGNATPRAPSTTDVAFFPDRGGDGEAAKAVCAGCLVRDDCLDYALDAKIMHGIWGGTSERERRKLRAFAA